MAETGRQASRPTGRAAQLSSSQLRPGWTTGACAAAGARAAWVALHTGDFPDPVEVTLPQGRRPAFALTSESLAGDKASAAVTKDAGDDPDVTHGAVIRTTVRRGAPGTGVRFVAGTGVGTITRPGLPLPVGEPAINPMPRQYITENLLEASRELGLAGAEAGQVDAVVEVAVDHGEELAARTWNPRIGIVGGISVLGTTGVVVPYSCSAWIASIHEGIDVARASGATHAAACTGSTSEATVTSLYEGVEVLDMGDFAGAVLKYLRRHPLPRLTICGGVAKLSKLANGYLDLHSHRTQVDTGHLAELATAAGASPELAGAVRDATTVAGAVSRCAEAGVDLAGEIAAAARTQALDVLRGAPVAVEVICTDRRGAVIARTGW
ncbi:MAG: cobalt-precorrin-5B (C(1))-methyltransferase [Actinomycetia bacterium]|nr:cobalt-precorrin-5B (C(1))-methyltransferase [Actinomycetes bacterium]